jgi:hypothetical protein
VEDHVDADLHAGRHHECIPLLEQMVSEEPLHERRWEMLMLALYRDGRQADALRSYQSARQGLAELGLEPGPALGRLEQAILDRDPRLDIQPGLVSPSPPASLPAALRAPSAYKFVGRSDERDTLARAFTQTRDGWRRLVLIGGEPGVGKTRLAIEFAKQCADEGAAVYVGECDPLLSIPYQPWMEVLAQLASAGATDQIAPEQRAALSVLLPCSAHTLRPPPRLPVTPISSGCDCSKQWRRYWPHVRRVAP